MNILLDFGQCFAEFTFPGSLAGVAGREIATLSTALSIYFCWQRRIGNVVLASYVT
jgi:hypothetical protein